ncbi:hypothetical protein, conserved, partial [Eimeria tenella]
MKRAAAQQQQGASQGPRNTRGAYSGESRPSEGFKIDRGQQYLMRSGFAPSTAPIGSTVSGHPEGEFESFLEGVGEDLVGLSVEGFRPVGLDALWGRSVALLFSAGTHPKCSSFIPFLAQFYKNVNEAGDRPKVEIIYVSLDESEAAFESSRQQMPWLSLQFNSPTRQKLIKRYRIYVDPR